MIQAGAVRLRAIERGDIPRFVHWLNDPEVTEFLLMSFPLSAEMEEKWYEKQLQNDPGDGQVLAIEVLVGDNWLHIGNTGLHNVNQISRYAEFGIFIGEKEYWNRGYGTIATNLTLMHGFENLNLNRIFLHVYQNNPRGIAAYEKAGFVKEGVLRQGVYKNGRYLDIIVMAMLKSEWDQLKGK